MFVKKAVEKTPKRRADLDSTCMSEFLLHGGALYDAHCNVAAGMLCDGAVEAGEMGETEEDARDRDLIDKKTQRTKEKL